MPIDYEDQGEGNLKEDDKLEAFEGMDLNAYLKEIELVNVLAFYNVEDTAYFDNYVYVQIHKEETYQASSVSNLNPKEVENIANL